MDTEVGMVDCSVGTIVWVRRRNGSWWPGKILGPHELSSSHLMSPRSGTPVKLLGREDASVDWYNLEKSKRVKAFRCGDFDACIERAEASQGMPPKKREKYARREDAILHALHLEKLQLPQPDDIHDFAAPDVRPRLRGLQDLSNSLLGKMKRLGNVEEETSIKRRDRRRPLVQVLKSSVKLPLTHSVHIGQEERITMVGVNDDCTPTLTVGLSQEFENNNTTTGSNEDTETDTSGTQSLGSDTYRAQPLLSDEGEEDIEFIPKSFGRYEGAGEHESMSDDDSELPEDSEDSLPLQPSSSSVTVSKWQLKGKRNSRRYAERKVASAAWMKEDPEPEPEPCLKGGYWEQYHDTGGFKSMLFDVDVEVQSGYQREHVPMISLMSKLNDKAIVGHPIPIETLEDASSDFILLSASADDDDSLADSTLQPWRTARRTAKSRVPRPPHLEEDQYEYLDEDGKGNGRAKKLQKKVQQRKNTTSSCNQKTRTLSSIGGTKQQQQQIMGSESYEDEGAMKRELLPTAVACIPVKLVFSRLHEELVARHQ